MRQQTARFAAAITLLMTLGTTAAPGRAEETAVDRIDAALQNITSIVRAKKVGYATIWDGNKYVQCRRLPSREMRCEAAGPTLQPTLKHILTIERQNRLAALGWAIDPAFGNYAKIFPADAPTGQISADILRTLTDAYDINLQDLELKTDWVVDIPCPPRNGPSQNLAGMVSGAPSMRSTALLTCSYTAKPQPQTAETAEALIKLYGPSVTAEIQRLRVNAAHRVYAVFDSGIGYIQCMPETPPVALYCEAASAESWAALSAVLNQDRIARLTAAGYKEPGRAPNYSKSYPLTLTDAAIAAEILTLLHDVYNYTGAPKLDVKTE